MNFKQSPLLPLAKSMTMERQMPQGIELVGKVHTVKGFFEWLRKLRGHNVTEVFLDELRSWQDESAFLDNKVASKSKRLTIVPLSLLSLVIESNLTLPLSVELEHDQKVIARLMKQAVSHN